MSTTSKITKMYIFKRMIKKKYVNCVFVTDDDLSPKVELNKSCAAKKWLK